MEISGDEHELAEVDAEAEAAAIKRATKQPNGIKKLLQSGNRPALYVIGAGLLMAGGVILYVNLSDNPAAKESKAYAGRSPGAVKFQAGGAANPAYARTFQHYQQKIQKQALDNGQSSAPSFVGGQENTSIMNSTATSTATSSAGSRKNQSVPAPQKTVIIETQAPTSSAAVAESVAMRKYQIIEMKALMGRWNASTGPIAVDYATKAAASSTSQSSPVAGSAGSVSTPSTIPAPPVIGAGNLFYSVADTSMDSDQPGPVLATLENGPLKGARLLGKFTNTHNRLVIVFNTATMPNNATVSIDAIAVNSNTNRTALATSVDHHYLDRYGLLIGGAFLQGFGEAVMTSGQTTVSGLGGVSSSISPRSIEQNAEASLGQVGQTVGQIGTQEFNAIKPTVRVAMGTGMGILFLKPVKAAVLTDALAGQSQSVPRSVPQAVVPERASQPLQASKPLMTAIDGTQGAPTPLS